VVSEGKACRSIRRPRSIPTVHRRGNSSSPASRSIDSWPLRQGRKIGLFGGAGVGLDRVIQEGSTTFARAHGRLFGVRGVGGVPAEATTSSTSSRIRLSTRRRRRAKAPSARWFTGQRTNPRAPCPSRLTGFDGREHSPTGPGVLFFVDKSTLTQAGLGVSALPRPHPSAVGLQPTLATDMGALQEAFTTTQKGSIYVGAGDLVPAADVTDPAPGLVRDLDAHHGAKPRDL